jgi:hypothetical protein
MVDHPLYAMWKARHAAELAAQAGCRELATVRQEQQREWREAWETYQRHWAAGQVARPRRRWWPSFRAWLVAPWSHQCHDC